MSDQTREDETQQQQRREETLRHLDEVRARLSGVYERIERMKKAERRRKWSDWVGVGLMGLTFLLPMMFTLYALLDHGLITRLQFFLFALSFGYFSGVIIALCHHVLFGSDE